MNRQELEKRILHAAHVLLQTKWYVAPVEVFLEAKLLTEKDYEQWRVGKIPYLEAVLRGNLSQLSFAMKSLRQFGLGKGLKQSYTSYVSWGKGEKIKLRFSKSGDTRVEKWYSTHFVRLASKNI